MENGEQQMRKYQCFFCRYKDFEKIKPVNRMPARALDLPEYSKIRIIDAENKETAISKFIEMYECDYDAHNGLIYPQCRDMEIQ